MRAAFAPLLLVAVLAGCAAGGCETTFSLVPLSRVTYEIEWNEVDARAGVLEAGFEPGELPYDPGTSVYATDGAITLISRATSAGSELSVSFPAQGERGLSEGALAERQEEAERDLGPALLSLVARFEEGSTWTRAAGPSWDHAVSQDDCV